MSDTEVSPNVDAERIKLEAEAECARAQAALHAANAREAEAKARKAELELIKAEETERARLKSDEHMRVYQFNGAVSDSTASACMAQLRLWDRLDPECPIEIIFNSPGGSVIPGMALFDLIVRLSKRGGGSHHITIGAQGYAASMAGILLQAADHRWCGKQSWILVHEVSAGTGGKIGDMLDAVKLYESMCNRVVDIFVSRSGGKCSKARFVKGWKRTDWWIESETAFKLGFVDEIR